MAAMQICNRIEQGKSSDRTLRRFWINLLREKLKLYHGWFWMYFSMPGDSLRLFKIKIKIKVLLFRSMVFTSCMKTLMPNNSNFFV